MYFTILVLSQILHGPITFHTVPNFVLESFEVQFVPSQTSSSNTHHNIYRYMLSHYLHVVTTNVKALAFNSMFRLQVLRDCKLSRSYPFRSHHYRSTLRIRPFISNPSSPNLFSMHFPYIPHDPYSCTYTFLITPTHFSNLSPILHLFKPHLTLPQQELLPRLHPHPDLSPPCRPRNRHLPRRRIEQSMVRMGLAQSDLRSR
jgi:hypothetical protein